MEPPASTGAAAAAAAPAPASSDDNNDGRRTLYLAGVGEAVGTDMEELRRMLEAFGPLDDDHNDTNKSPSAVGGGAIQAFAGKGYVLARFRTAADAGRAKEGLAGRVVQGRPLTVHFSNLSSEEDDDENAAGGPPPEPLDPAETTGVVVPGLELVEEFLTPEEETALLAFADRDGGRHWATHTHPGMARRVQHYGYAFDYATRGVDFEGLNCAPMPFHGEAAGASGGVFAAVVARVLRSGLLRMAPDQMTLNEYTPGQGIAGHVETHDAFRDGLLSLSLGAPVVMDLREPLTGQRKALHLPPRSALAMHGEARYLWTHAIPARTWDKLHGIRHPRAGRRVSLTLRRVIPPLHPSINAIDSGSSQQQGRRRPCLCPFPDRCPTSPREARQAYLDGCRRGDGAIVPPEARRPTPLERSNVHAVYETISTHWNHTRAIRRVHWPRVVGFLQSLPPYALIADIGCGDGKYLELRRYSFHPTAFALGCDRSVRLLACAARASQQEQEGEGEGGSQQEQGQGDGKESGNGGRQEPSGVEVFACDVLQVPFRDGAFDAALCIAVLHHLSTEAHRVQALRELCRVVRVGGVFDVHIWAMEQDEGGRRRFDGQDQLVPFKMQAKYAAQPLETLAAASAAATTIGTAAVAVAASEEAAATSTNAGAAAASEKDGASSHSDATSKSTNKPPPPIVEAVPASVDARAKLVTYERYCHVYREWELEALLNKLGNEFELEIVDRGYDKGNWFCTVRKVGDALLAGDGSG